MPSNEHALLDNLVDWLRLSPDTVKGVYASLSPGTRAPKWKRLLLDAEHNLRRAPTLRELLKLALRAAQAGGFLNPFATTLVRLDEDDGERDPVEVARLLAAFVPFGVMQAIVNAEAGLMPARTLKVLNDVCEATGWIEIGGKVTGTAFLVERPDLVLTAGHAVLDEEEVDGGGRQWSMAFRHGLSFHFIRSDGSEQTILPKEKRPLSSSLPWGVPPNHLDGRPGAVGRGALDYALVELVEPVEHGRPLDIRDPGDFKGKMKCFVIGFPGGRELRWDGNLIETRDDAAARIEHRANTLEGMSGGCCVYADGTLIGLHEGTITQRNETGQPVLDHKGMEQRLNRAVMLAPIRTAQRAGGSDPLETRQRARALRLADSGAVGRLRNEGARLAGDLAGDWLRAHAALAASARGHPWFRRKDLEDWVARLAQESKDRLFFVTGERGTGKSFLVEIIAALLQPRDLLRITPSQVNDWSFDVSMSGLVPLSDASWRTRDGAVHYDWVPALVAALAKRGDARRTAREPLVVTIDFENGDAFRADNSPWRSFIETLVAEPWSRLVLIGLSVAERGAIMDQLETNPVTSAIRPPSLFELRTISSTGANAAASNLTPLLTHFIDMAKANGLEINRDVAMEFLTGLREKLPESLRAAPPQLEASLSALLAIGFQSLLDQAAGRA